MSIHHRENTTFQMTRHFIIAVMISWNLFAIHNDDVSEMDQNKNVLKYKLYFNTIRRQRKQRLCKKDNGSKKTHLLLLILLAVDVEMNPGPVFYPRCLHSFDRQSRLDQYLLKQ